METKSFKEIVAQLPEGSALSIYSGSILPGFESTLVQIDFIENTHQGLLESDQLMQMGEEVVRLAEAGQYPKELALIFEETIITLDKLLQAEEFSTITLAETEPVAFIDMSLEILQSLIGLKFQCIKAYACDAVPVEDPETGEFIPAIAYEFLILND